MPELPEVEVLRRSLEPRLVGARIARVEVHDPRLRERVSARKLARATEGCRVLALDRRAKYLLAHVEGGSTLVLHLGMSGRLTIVPAREPRMLHEHVAFHLTRGGRLRFVDPRRFGLVLALPTERLATDPHFGGLGIEPLGDPASGTPPLDGDYLRHNAAGRSAPVKAYVMDAGVVVGVGNIYASEALHQAGIDPRRSVARIGAARWELLAQAVREVLGRAIEQGGTTLNDFVDGEGNPGYFQVSLAVYDREGEPCPRCGAAIRRIVQSGRSTYFCPGCQR
ncbi:MAG TPA: bifunctional DNA-formamidopyrimidine glycosylase/DNA-(apurinic or apyrimidinic site) lyase [Thermoanaerobaculia bacterium]|nr:bifunctional DNA-formamidopyrimidine glycosylase/DNA-(apurinic or apyrimidinic site) lyase [Thermoanaerobaculia bacterium]